MKPIRKIAAPPVLITPLTLFAAIVAGSLTFAAAGVQAQEITAPEPVATMGRHMPGFGNEAIVKARYTVKADGTTDDVQLFDYLSNQFVSNMLRGYVEDWTFKPATIDGEAIDLYNQEWVFALRVDPNAPPPPQGGPGGRGGFGGPPPAPPGAGEGGAPVIDFSNMQPIPLALSLEVKEAVDEISALVSEEKMDDALKEVARVERRALRTVFDYALVNELRASILMAQEQFHEALEASKLATMSAVDPRGDRMYFLEDAALESALKKKLLLAATLRQNALALETYEELTGRFEVPGDDAIHRAAESAKSALDSSDPLPLLAKIVDNKRWTHKPVRRIFTVTDVDGRLNDIVARCERRNLELKYQENVDWTLPESLGNCVLDFEGRDGTTFVVYEFAE